MLWTINSAPASHGVDHLAEVCSPLECLGLRDALVEDGVISGLEGKDGREDAELGQAF